MSDDLRSAFHRAAEAIPDTPGRLESVLLRRRRRQRRRATAAVALSALGLVAGAVAVEAVSGTRSPSELVVAATPTPTAAPGPQDPLALVGRWHLTASGVPRGASLVLGDDLVLFLPCGVVDGGWRATGPEGLFVGQVTETDQGCPRAFTQPWLAAARRFRVQGEDRLLLDEQGAVVATLSPGATPTVGPNRAGSFAAPPTVSAQERRDATAPAALPPGVTAPTAAQLERRWVPFVDPTGKAFVSFDPDGTWQGSDGCTGVGGPYALGPGGRFLVITGPTPAVLCIHASPANQWVVQAARVGLAGSELVFFDAGAKELGRLRPG